MRFRDVSSCKVRSVRACDSPAHLWAEEKEEMSERHEIRAKRICRRHLHWRALTVRCRLGNVQAADVPQVVDEVVAWHAMQGDRDSQSGRGKQPPVCASFWRGRMGLEKDSQVALASKIS